MYLTLCPLGFSPLFLLPAEFFFFQNQLVLNIISGISSECQTDWIQIRPDVFVGPDLGPNCLQKLSADDIGK